VLRRKRKREKEPSGSAAVKLAVAPADSATHGQAGKGGERPLEALAPEILLASVKSPFALGSSSGTLGRMSSPSRLEPPSRRLLTLRCSGRVYDKVPSPCSSMRAAELNR
jgi:hypothetical protein